MASIPINYPDGQGPRIIASLCSFFHYKDTITKSDGTIIPNPETKPVFVKRMILQQIRSWVIEGEKQNTIQTALTALEADINQNVTLS